MVFVERKQIETVVMIRSKRKDERNHPERNSYYEEMKPIFIVFRIIGRFPYGFTKTGFASFSLLSWPFFYSLVFNLFCYYISLSAIKVIVTEKIAKSRNYDVILLWMLLIVFCLQTFTAPFTFWWDAPNVVNYCKMWSEFENQWSEGHVKSKKRYQFSRIFTFALIPLVMMFIFLESYLLTDFSILMFMPFIPIALSHALTLTYWCLTLNKLNRCIEQLQKIIFERSNIYEMDFKRRIWLKICTLISEIGNATGASGLCSLIGNFITFVLACYGFLVSLTSSEPMSGTTLGLLLGAGYCTCYSYVLSNTGHNAMTTVGPKFLKNVLELNVSHLKKSTLSEINLLIKSIAMKLQVIEYIGFVSIGRKTFGYFLFSTLTYLIVLLQFKPHRGKQLDTIETTLTNATGNDTYF